MILFFIKNNESYGGLGYSPSSGLRNSIQFIVDKLKEVYLPAELISVTDSNEIDRYVALYKPTKVFIEAIWCPPYKLRELVKLHPKVQWTVRIHSNVPFLANEGVAVRWLKEYDNIPNVNIAVNDVASLRPLNTFLNNVYFLPNYYPIKHILDHKESESDVIRIGCFGAIRPMKNQLQQAIASVAYAQQVDKTLEFHINETRTEQRGEQVLRNIEALFEGRDNVSLVKHPWYSHKGFIEVIGKMDLSMQVSLSETFNIVTADAVSQGVPICVSDEIYWAIDESKADPNVLTSILKVMGIVLGEKRHEYAHENKENLKRYSYNSYNTWIKYLLDRDND